MTCYC